MHQNYPTMSLQISPQEAATELLARRLASRSLTSFIEYLDVLPPGQSPAKHHKLLIEHLEAVERGELTKLMVLMPPGSAKSTYASVLFPPWFMGRHPQDNILGVSNNIDLAETFSRRARNLVSGQRYRNAFGFGCAQDTKSASSWANEEGGTYFAAGVGTAIAGRRADLAIIDDPVRNREEADSEGVRDKQWEWYVSDFTTRLKPHARQILIQTRWHEDDLGGRLLDREGSRWHVLKLPMEAGPNDPLGREFGERLWPEWFTDAMVLEHKTRDARTWSALFQQEPAPEEGTYFKREWFYDYQITPAGLHIYGASDYAVSEGGGDFTEHGVFGIDFNGAIYVLDWWRGQKDAAHWIETQIDLIVKHQPLIWFGEGGPIRKTVEPFLKKRMQERNAPCRLEWLPSVVDKVIRARGIQAKASMGDVFLPQQAGWKAEIMKQLLQFPTGKYDDAVDVFSLMGRGLEHTRAPAIRKQTFTAAPAPAPQGWMS
jgi:predicted phage terminase large subunit-like protein